MKIWPLIIEILMSLMKFITVDCLWWSSNSSINLHAAHPLSVVVHSQILIKVSIFFLCYSFYMTNSLIAALYLSNEVCATLSINLHQAATRSHHHYVHHQHKQSQLCHHITNLLFQFF